MKNFPVNVDGKEYWISRSNAVVGIIYKYENGEYYILANKRGKGCPDYVGKWNIPCGYVDYDENIFHAVSREIFEETGLNVPENHWSLWVVNSDPSDEKQTISFRFYATYGDYYGELSTEHSEPDEVEEIKWIPFSEIENYEWAFNQLGVVLDFKKSIETNELTNPRGKYNVIVY
jgi:8-oxo-dGTP pyrophosphatase MutT (NUDIX family)